MIYPEDVLEALDDFDADEAAEAGETVHDCIDRLLAEWLGISSEEFAAKSDAEKAGLARDFACIECPDEDDAE